MPSDSPTSNVPNQAWNAINIFLSSAAIDPCSVKSAQSKSVLGCTGKFAIGLINAFTWPWDPPEVGFVSPSSELNCIPIPFHGPEPWPSGDAGEYLNVFGTLDPLTPSTFKFVWFVSGVVLKSQLPPHFVLNKSESNAFAIQGFEPASLSGLVGFAVITQYGNSVTSLVVQNELNEEA